MSDNNEQQLVGVDQCQPPSEKWQLNNTSLFLDEESMMKYKQRCSQLFSTSFESSRLIEFCLSRSELKRSSTRIEAERILLLSDLKHRMLEDEINRGDYMKTENLPKKGCVEISNVRMPLIYSSGVHPEIERYYVVTFQCGDQLLSSEVLRPNSHSYLEVEGTFTFRDLSHDFVMKVSIYSMYIEKKVASIWDNKMCLPLKYVKRFFTRRTTFPTYYLDKRESSFKIHGQCELTLSKICSSPFTINSLPPTICLISTMECEIKRSVILCNRRENYSDIGHRKNGKTDWNLYYVAFIGTKLLMWNNYRDRKTCSPKELDLARCITQKVEPPKVDSPKTFLMRFKSEGGSVDEFNVRPRCKEEDFKHWLNEINAVLEILFIWKCMEKCRC